MFFRRFKERGSKEPVSASQEALTRTESIVKAPSTFTEQVIVGLFNDIFSHCVFRSINEREYEVTPLVESLPTSDDNTCMLVLRRRTKGNIEMQILSHNFKTCYEPPEFYGYSLLDQDPSQYAEYKPKYGEVAQYLSLGLASGLKAHVKRQKESSKVPISIIKNYLHKDVNRGGIWAYLSAPILVDHNVTDETALKLQRDRKAKLMEISKEKMGIIDSHTIISLLWSICIFNLHAKFHDLLVILCNEFLEFYSENASKLIHVLYLCEQMEILPHEDISEYISSLGNVSILETLSPEDLIILINSARESDSLTVQKITVIIHDYIEIIAPEFAVHLLWGLVNSKFNFQKNDLFTKRLFIRFVEKFEEIPIKLLKTFFNALMLVPMDIVAYFNCIIYKSLRMLHLIDRKGLILIGCSYSMSHNTAEILKYGDSLDDDEEEPTSNIYEYLKYIVKIGAKTYRPNSIDILSVIYKYLVSGLTCAGEPNFTSYEYKSISSHGGKKIIAGLEESLNMINPQANENSYKIFFSNLMEDCCRNFAELDSEATNAIIFSLITLKIDIRYLHQMMLMDKGEIVKSKNQIQIEVIDPESPKYVEQFQMAKEIMEYMRNKEGISEELSIKEIVPSCNALSGAQEEQVDPEDIQPIKSTASETGTFFKKAQLLLDSGDDIKLCEVVEMLKASPDSLLSRKFEYMSHSLSLEVLVNYFDL
ncbi:conserved hypothetical protein [Theileria equi strain WA]|uniref:Uncharacterized protein n=1 Tax=Theileria equi strain WA TaxID=1537102 RepID=L1L984_THEEQ|nr:conserved hypothetical protein [Theileria equi strain WA]EKX72061.1 conserved hypothetical protein [Theileria equi strain WA]|eukprot:XP_004831513.1 conserved hypothetical protein [Theileria equi strain WA]